ncbi:MAG TPA: glutathione S-transferase N-terminal domain-containing protein [Thermoleophilaceae bacterium]|jgi:glutathione S-transferase
MGARLYGIPGSHPAMAAQLMLDHRGVEYKRVDLLTPMHRAIVRLLGFPGITVPALKADGQRIQGTGEIARWLDSTGPGPPLVPEDPDLRRRVEEAEEWADEDLQRPVRRTTLWALTQHPPAVRSFLEGARTGMPAPLLARTSGPFIKSAGRLNAVSDEQRAADLAAFPAIFDRIDGYIAEGTIGGEDLNVADYQIGASIRLLMCLDDFRPALEARPLGAHALRVAPDFPGRIPPVLDDAARATALGERDAA